MYVTVRKLSHTVQSHIMLTSEVCHMTKQCWQWQHGWTMWRDVPIYVAMCNRSVTSQSQMLSQQAGLTTTQCRHRQHSVNKCASTGCGKKVSPKVFLQFFQQLLRILRWNFIRLLPVYSHITVPKNISLYGSTTQLLDFLCNHIVIFHIHSLQNNVIFTMQKNIIIRTT